MLAYMIDYFLTFALALVVQMLTLWLLEGQALAAQLANLYVLAGLFLALNAAHHIVLESHPVIRATLGKFVCGLQVLDVEGRPLDAAQAKQRFLWRLPSIALFMLPYLIAARGHYALALHDRKAFTIVTTRMTAKRLQSGLLAGRQKTRLDKLCLVMAGLFLPYLLVSLLMGLTRSV
jgi:uncharacterized RDD family membrane protein YckC